MLVKITFVSLLVILSGIALPVASQPEEGFKNLTLLPADISRDSLQIVMRGYASALGTGVNVTSHLMTSRRSTSHEP